MEEVIIARIKALSASFRRILDYNYQRTYPLPPPTTIWGFVGAAMGLSDRQLWANNSVIRKLKISVLATNVPGFAKDLWSIKKIKQGKIDTRSPYFRELLFFPQYLLVFGGDKEVLNKVEKAFRDPTYALSLGREDELVRIIDLKRDFAKEGTNIFSGTILPLNIREINFEPILREGIIMEPPIVDKLPTEFTINKKGVRTPKNKKEYTFIPPTLTIKIKECSFKVYSVEGRNFVWLN